MYAFVISIPDKAGEKWELEKKKKGLDLLPLWMSPVANMKQAYENVNPLHLQYIQHCILKKVVGALQ
jgi:hypothetical protein